MTDDQLVARTESVFAGVFGRQVPFDVTLSRLNEARWTSLRHVEFIIGLEREFGVRFDGADATDMTSIAVVLERVQQRLGLSVGPTGGLFQAYLLRTVEQALLRLFAAGKVSGTTHTCIGQEMSAMALEASLDQQRDIIFSNHRCHGHYFAWTDDVDGLVAEVMGKRSGVCGGLGGSQHLCAHGFFSNGIQGGIVPVSAGLAFAQKLAAQRGIVAVCIGDGTLGEGVVYETLNIAEKWRLPLLMVLENNSVAQSTSQAETLAGDISARAAAFGIPVFRGDTWEHGALAREMYRAADACAPNAVLHSYTWIPIVWLPILRAMTIVIQKKSRVMRGAIPSTSSWRPCKPPLILHWPLSVSACSSRSRRRMPSPDHASHRARYPGRNAGESGSLGTRNTARGHQSRAWRMDVR